MIAAAWLCLGSLLMSGAYCKRIPSFAGPYISYAHRFDVCSSDGTFVVVIKNSHFHPAKPFEKQRIWINATNKDVFDDTVWMHFNLAVRSNNEWKDNAFLFNFPSGGCSAMRENVPSLFRILTRSTPEVHDKKTPCKWLPGQYYFENESVSWEFPKIKVMPYGHYRLTVTAGRGSRVKKMCLQVDCEAIPKPN